MPNQTPTPTPQNNIQTPPALITSTDQFNPPAGLSVAKTEGGGTGYKDIQGNIYVQSSPGKYTLLPATPTPVTPVAPTTPTPPSPPTPSPASSSTTPSNSTQPQNNQGTFYYTQTKDASGKITTTYYDGQGNPLQTNPIGGDQYKENPQGTPNSQGKLVQLSSPPTIGSTQKSPTLDQLNQGILGSNTGYINKLNDLNAQSDSAYNDFITKYNQVENGTFPLTSAQQAIVNATKEQLDQLRENQIVANTAYTQGTEVYAARIGNAQSATQTAAGTIKNAIDNGIAKLNALDSQAALTLAQLQQGFQQDNLKMITEAHDAWTKYVSDKQNALKEIQDSTTQALKDLRDFTYKQVQDNITNTLNSDKFTYQQKQDQIQNQLNQSQLDETKRKNLVDEAQKQQALNLQKAANDMIAGAYQNQQLQGIPQTLPDGSPNPKYQDTFLQSLSPSMQNLVKGIADYTIDPHSLSTSARQAMGGLTQAQALALVKQYDPSYSQGNYAIRNSFLKNWNVGGQNSVIQAANTSIDHLAKLYTESQQLGNVDSGSLGPFTEKYNSITQWLNEGSQNPAVSRFKQDALALAGEQARIYKNGTGSSAAPSDDEIKQQLSILTSNLAPDTAKSVIQNGINLMTDRLTSATENYQSVMGKPPESILYGTALGNIQQLQNDGFQIDISKLNPSPYSGMTTDQFLNSLGSSNTTTNQSTSDFFSSLLQNAQSTTQ